MVAVRVNGLVPFVSVAVRIAVVAIRFIRVVVSPWVLLKSPPPAKSAAKSVSPNGNTMDVDPVARPSPEGVKVMVSRAGALRASARSWGVGTGATTQF